jgi:hypothetical protein
MTVTTVPSDFRPERYCIKVGLDPGGTTCSEYFLERAMAVSMFSWHRRLTYTWHGCELLYARCAKTAEGIRRPALMLAGGAEDRLKVGKCLGTMFASRSW